VAGVDRYFGGRDGEAAKFRKRCVSKHGAAKGERVYQAELAKRRKAYAGRGRGVGLQRTVRDS
jgi:hypothetical protein